MLNIKSIKVIKGKIIGEAFVLQGAYVDDEGRTHCNAEHLTDDERRAINLYPVSEIIPAYDANYQVLVNPTYTIVYVSEVVPHDNTDEILHVELNYSVKNNTAIYPNLVTKRLDNFAKEKDIDLSEIGLLMNCNVVAWHSEAERFMNLYTSTWTEFYNANANLTDWREIEATLPILSWG